MAGLGGEPPEAQPDSQSTQSNHQPEQKQGPLGRLGSWVNNKVDQLQENAQQIEAERRRIHNEFEDYDIRQEDTPRYLLDRQVGQLKERGREVYAGIRQRIGRQSVTPEAIVPAIPGSDPGTIPAVTSATNDADPGFGNEPEIDLSVTRATDDTGPRIEISSNYPDPDTEEHNQTQSPNVLNRLRGKIHDATQQAGERVRTFSDERQRIHHQFDDYEIREQDTPGYQLRRLAEGAAARGRVAVTRFSRRSSGETSVEGDPEPQHIRVVQPEHVEMEEHPIRNDDQHLVDQRRTVQADQGGTARNQQTHPEQAAGRRVPIPVVNMDDTQQRLRTQARDYAAMEVDGERPPIPDEMSDLREYMARIREGGQDEGEHLARLLQEGEGLSREIAVLDRQDRATDGLLWIPGEDQFPRQNLRPGGGRDQQRAAYQDDLARQPGYSHAAIPLVIGQEPADTDTTTQERGAVPLAGEDRFPSRRGASIVGQVARYQGDVSRPPDYRQGTIPLITAGMGEQRQVAAPEVDLDHDPQEGEEPVTLTETATLNEATLDRFAELTHQDIPQGARDKPYFVHPNEGILAAPDATTYVEGNWNTIEASGVARQPDEILPRFSQAEEVIAPFIDLYHQDPTYGSIIPDDRFNEAAERDRDASGIYHFGVVSAETPAEQQQVYDGYCRIIVREAAQTDFLQARMAHWLEVQRENQGNIELYQDSDQFNESRGVEYTLLGGINVHTDDAAQKLTSLWEERVRVMQNILDTEGLAGLQDYHHEWIMFLGEGFMDLDKVLKAVKLGGGSIVKERPELDPEETRRREFLAKAVAAIK